MTAAVVALAVVAAAGLVTAGRVRHVARSRTGDLARSRDEARAALARAEERIAALDTRVGELTAALDSVAPAPDPSAAGSDPPAFGPAAVLDALWALNGLDRARARRRAEAVSTAPESPPSPGEASGLAASLDDEVARLRDETGTPGTLRASLDVEPPSGDALLVLRSVQALLAELSRHCQGYDLYLHRWDGRLLASLVCEGFDGPDAALDATSEVEDALRVVDGRLEVDKDPHGRLRARVSIPSR